METKAFWSLRPRIFTMLLLLLTLVFFAVYISFNVFINSYIESNVNMQLDIFSSQHPREDKDDNMSLPDMSDQPPSKVGVEAKAFVIDSSFNVIRTNNEPDLDEAIAIARYLKAKNISLNKISNLEVNTSEKEYYISSIVDKKHDDAYLVFYVDVTTLRDFANTINSAFIIIIAIAIVLSFGISILIASSIAKPVKQLSNFAKKIGTGDFEKQEFSFKDKEFDGLAKVMNASAVQLSEYDKEQKKFFQNVSHELRTPLMSIKCYAEGIKHNLMEKDTSSEVIISETDRLTDLVEDLLYISRIDNITQDLPMTEGDLRETLSLSAENQKSLAIKKNIKFVYDFDDNPVLFKYNEKHMYRAFYNLIANAIQYSQSEIVLICKVVDDNISISIIDDGIGIREESIPHVFERFYKGESGKTGIGLSIVKSVVELHKGSVKVNSKDLTEFKILF